MLCFAVTSELDDLRGIAFGLLPSATERLKPTRPTSGGCCCSVALFARFFW